MIAHVKGRLASKSADRVVVETPGGVGYEVVVPLGVMERLPTAGADITLATELVVREDGWALYGFLDEAERRFFQRDRKSTRLNSSHSQISYAVFCLKKKNRLYK